MTVLPVDALPEGTVLEADLCVVGTGPAALSLVSALGGGIRVCLVESGGERPDGEAQRLNDLGVAGEPIREDFINRLRMLGGTSNLWPGRCMALEATDFRVRDWVPGSGWPIPFEDYRRSLEPAARILGLPGTDTAAASDPLAQGGLAPKPAVWAKAPARFWDLFGPTLARSEMVDVFTGLTATGLDFDGTGGRVTGLAARTRAGAAVTLRAGTYVLATGGIENARLLLLARRAHPRAAIPEAALGRYFMDHPRAVCGSVRLAPGVDLSPYLGRPVAGGMAQAGLGLAPEVQEREGLLNAYVYLEKAASDLASRSYETTAHFMRRALDKGRGRPLSRARTLIHELTPREVLPHDLYRLYVRARKLVKDHARDLVIVNHCEQVPDPDSRIALGADLDRFGNPLPVLRWRRDGREVETLVRLHRLLRDRLEAAKIGAMTSDPEDLRGADFLDASHHMGATRMAASPRDGVVDGDLRVHGVDNLYVCGSSVFPTGGSANPTWTIVALSLRLAEHLAARMAAP